ncbi:HipA N-terminal domain-containing protein [Streptomyces venezuelae ATCC 10712]
MRLHRTIPGGREPPSSWVEIRGAPAGADYICATTPPWFSNLLPEGVLRRWIADDRKVSPDREMELLAQVGHDLPGAVRVIDIAEEDDEADWDFENDAPTGSPQDPAKHVEWRFSLAGVGLKFSMLRNGDRLTLPAFGQGEIGSSSSLTLTTPTCLITNSR